MSRHLHLNHGFEVRTVLNVIETRLSLGIRLPPCISVFLEAMLHCDGQKRQRKGEN